MNKRFLTSLAVGAFALAATAARATIILPLDPDHTSASFTVSHLTITKVTGQIPLLTSNIVLGNDHIPTAVTATLDASKIDTHDAKRDKDLRSDHWFDVETFPTITFRSAKIHRLNKSDFTIDGTLTLHGITKPVTLAATYTGSAKDPWGYTHFGFNATGSIDRTAFDVGHAPAALVGDDVTIELQVEAIKK